jgi:hypothetical protein
LEASLPIFESVVEWDFDTLHKYLFALIKKMGVKTGVILCPLRVALSGKQITHAAVFRLLMFSARQKRYAELELVLECLGSSSPKNLGHLSTVLFCQIKSLPSTMFDY